MIHHTTVQMRFADTDALGHVNNRSHVVYAEIARLDFFRALGASVQTLILARIAVDFRAQTTYNQNISVDTTVARVGITSVKLMQAVVADGKIVADIESVVVHFDYAQNRPSPWSDGERNAFLPFVKGK